MATASPSPNSPTTPSSSNSSTTDPPASSTPAAPSPQSPPSTVPATPPPSPPVSSPPPQSSSAPPPSPPDPPPPASSPPSPPSPPPLSPPAATPPSSPPNVTSPPSSSSPPAPPQSSPAPPVANTPPPSQAVSPSPPPPANVPNPPSSNSPPPPVPKAPESSPPPPSGSQSAPPPSSNSSSTPTLPPPPLAPSSSLPAPNSPAPPSNSSSNPTISPLPSIPTEKPTPTNGTSVSENAASTGNGGLSTGDAAAIGIVASFVVLSLIVMAAWFVRKRKKRSAGSKLGYTMPSPYSSSQNSDAAFFRANSPAPLVGSGSRSDFIYSSSEAGGVSNSRPWFTYQELGQATNGFSAQNLLGEGGFGCVYKGVLTDGREVAVKQLKIGGGQGEREFQAEVEIISRVHHRHLVSLVGYCISDHQRLLVYDFVPNNTLDYHLHGHNKPGLDWATRVKVAAGAARGIAYLHEDCHPRIIHRDIKSSNILLDRNFEAQVSDFGLARLALDTCTHVSTRVMGTFGYMAPEYATSGKLTEKSDVYSFGVVLLELITGRKPVDDSQPIGDESLVEWARPLLTQALDNGRFEELVDPSLEKKYVDSELFRMIEAAAACVRHSAAKRPRMSQVVRAFESIDESSDLSNGMKPGQSEIYDSAAQSAQIRMFQRMAFGSQNYSSGLSDRSQSSWESREHNI